MNSWVGRSQALKPQRTMPRTRRTPWTSTWAPFARWRSRRRWWRSSPRCTRTTRSSSRRTTTTCEPPCLVRALGGAWLLGAHAAPGPVWRLCSAACARTRSSRAPRADATAAAAVPPAGTITRRRRTPRRRTRSRSCPTEGRPEETDGGWCEREGRGRRTPLPRGRRGTPEPEQLSH